jgi:hypothetical protein
MLHGFTFGVPRFHGVNAPHFAPATQAYQQSLPGRSLLRERSVLRFHAIQSACASSACRDRSLQWRIPFRPSAVLVWLIPPSQRRQVRPSILLPPGGMMFLRTCGAAPRRLATKIPLYQFLSAPSVRGLDTADPRRLVDPSSPAQLSRSAITR